MWYREGTISFTQGSNIVTGAGTAWNVTANGVLPGMIVIGPDNKLHEIKRVDSDTSMVLAEPYAGETQVDVPCVIITTYEGDLTQFSARFTALMTRMSADSKAMRSWLTALDEVTLEAADGTEIKVKSLLQIVNEHNENQQWYRDHVDTIESESSKALAAAARSEAAAAEALNSKQAAAGSEANAKASENAAAASQQAAATSESNARASKEAAAASQTAALQSEQAAAASQNAAHQSEESAANSEASALASKEAASVSQTAAANSEQAAKASEAEAARYANDSLAYSNNAKASQDAAAESQASALESKNTAVASKDAAAASQAAAAASETNAAAHADTAKSEAEKAKQFADLLDVNNVLHKDQNLADLPDRSAARKTLQVQAVISRDPEINGTQGDYNSFTNPQSTYELRIANNGEWRVACNDNNGTSALSIGAGGTGATDVSRAKKNFELERFVQTSNSTVMRFGTFGLNLTSDGTWGVTQSGVSGWIPLGMAQGGTGANNLTQSRKNLQIDRIVQADVYTSMFSPDGVKELSVRNDSAWGMFDDALKDWVPLAIGQGGTGARSIDELRRNLLVDTINRAGAQSLYYAPDMDTYLFVYNHGDWGVYDKSAGTRKPLPIESGGTGGYNQYTARKALGIATDDVVWFKGLVAFDITGVGGAWTAVVRKLQDQAASDGANLLSYVENKWFGVQNYVAGAPGQQYQYVWSFNTFGGNVVWYSMRNDNGFYTPEGRCAIQGSDVRIKYGFELPKSGAWERIKQIGVMEFYYKGNPVLQRGYLAQQMAEIDDTYVFFGGTATDECGKEFEIMNVNDRAVIADLITVVQMLQDENEKQSEIIKKQQDEIDSLQAELVRELADLKAVVTSLRKDNRVIGADVFAPINK